MARALFTKTLPLLAELGGPKVVRRMSSLAIKHGRETGIVSAPMDNRVFEFLKTVEPETLAIHLKISDIQAKPKDARRATDFPNKAFASLKAQFIATDPTYAAAQRFMATIQPRKNEFSDHGAVRYPNRQTAMSAIESLIQSGTFQYPGVHTTNEPMGVRLAALEVSILGSKQNAIYLVSTEPEGSDQAPIRRLFVSWLDKDGPNFAPRLDRPLPLDLQPASDVEAAFLHPTAKISQRAGHALPSNHFTPEVGGLGYTKIADFVEDLVAFDPGAIKFNPKTKFNVDHPDLDQRAFVSSDPETGQYLEVVVRHESEETGLPSVGFAGKVTVQNIGSSSMGAMTPKSDGTES
ncbi:MAG: hypothetical protein ACI9BD_000207 [Candidatus Marinamargulisbacteria bacterium]|jgi:hypothetical protein